LREKLDHCYQKREELADKKYQWVYNKNYIQQLESKNEHLSRIT
jgi:hypothetical protein